MYYERFAVRLKDPDKDLSLLRDAAPPKDLRLSVLAALSRSMPLWELGSGSSIEPQSAAYCGVCTPKDSLNRESLWLDILCS